MKENHVLRYKLWNIENVVLLQILGQKIFPAQEFTTTSKRSIVSSGLFSLGRNSESEVAFPSMKITLPSCPAELDCKFIASVSMESADEAREAIQEINDTLKEWVDVATGNQQKEPSDGVYEL